MMFQGLQAEYFTSRLELCPWHFVISLPPTLAPAPYKNNLGLQDSKSNAEMNIEYSYIWIFVMQKEPSSRASKCVYVCGRVEWKHLSAGIPLVSQPYSTTALQDSLWSDNLRSLSSSSHVIATVRLFLSTHIDSLCPPYYCPSILSQKAWCSHHHQHHLSKQGARLLGS